MNTPSYNFAPLGSFDYASMMNDQYLLAALQAPNVNFKASQIASNTQTSNNTQTLAQIENSGAIPVNYAQTAPDESNTGLWVTGAIGAAALIACMCKKGSGGNPIKGAKLWYEKFFGTAGEKASSDGTKTILSKMQAVKNGNGEIKLNVPNQTRIFAGTHINAGVSEYGIKGAISAERKAFNPQLSGLNSFQLVDNGNLYTVILKDGNPVKIVQGKVKDGNILQRLTEAKSDTDDGKLLARIKNIVQELGKDKKDVSSTLLQDVKNIRFTNNFGDDSLKLTIDHYGNGPQLRAFRTLKQFNKDDVPVLQYKPSESEKIFNNELTKQDNFLGIRYGKKALVDGVKVISVPPTEIAGAKCFFEGDKLVKIIKDGNPYEVGSNGFIQFVEKNEKAIEEFKKDVFVDKIYDKIPVGSVIA